MVERLKEGVPVDWQDLVGRFTMDSATEFLFGTCVNSLHASIPYAKNAVLSAVERQQAELGKGEEAARFLAAFDLSMQVRARYLFCVSSCSTKCG